MVEITTNAALVAAKYRDRAAALAPAVRASVGRAALAVERAMVRRLEGSGAPWSYPVPNRTGHLSRSTFVQQPAANMAVVGNNADYAMAIHSGLVSQWAGRGKHRTVQHEPRPFLDDAVKDADPASIVYDGVAGAILEMAV
jgi:phage gpG-like protein